MILLFFFVALALGVSFLCSVLESVLLSITPGHVSLLEQQKHPASARLRPLKENIDRPLAAILSLNTIANTVGATGAGAQAMRVFGSAWIGVFSAVFTFLVLTCAEIIPKTLGAVHWKRLTPLVVRVLPPLVVLMAPFVKLAKWLTRLLTPSGREPVVSRDEIAALAEEGRRIGVVEEDETRVVRNLLRLASVSVDRIMTAANEIVALDDDADVSDGMRIVSDVPYSRLPLLEERNGSRRCTGYVLRDDVLELAANDQHGTPVSRVRRDVLAVTRQTPVPDVFDRLVDRREHIALVTDGDRLAGIVTLEDIFEALLGVAIEDEGDDASAPPVRQSRR